MIGVLLRPLAQDARQRDGSGFELDHNTMTEENVGSIGLMVSERDRLIGIRPKGDDPGFLLTRPFLINGRRLAVNAKVTGTLASELRTDGNKTIKGWSFDDCDPLTKSGFSEGMTWQGRSLNEVPEAEVRILFRLENTALFTFELPP